MAPTYEAKSSLLVKFGREIFIAPRWRGQGPQITFNQEEA